MAELWGPVTNQSSPSRAKHVCTLPRHMLAGSPDITATRHVLTSSTTQPRWPRLPGRQCSPWEFKQRDKALVSSSPVPVRGRDIQDLLHKRRSHPQYQGVRRAVCTSKTGYAAWPPLLLPLPIPSSPPPWMCCLNQSRVTSPFSLGINGALLGIFKRDKIKHHGTTENLNNNPYPRSEANPRNDGACVGILLPLPPLLHGGWALGVTASGASRPAPSQAALLPAVPL